MNLIRVYVLLIIFVISVKSSELKNSLQYFDPWLKFDLDLDEAVDGSSCKTDYECDYRETLLYCYPEKICLCKWNDDYNFEPKILSIWDPSRRKCVGVEGSVCQIYKPDSLIRLDCDEGLYCNRNLFFGNYHGVCGKYNLIGLIFGILGALILFTTIFIIIRKCRMRKYMSRGNNNPDSELPSYENINRGNPGFQLSNTSYVPDLMRQDSFEDPPPPYPGLPN